MVVEVNTPTPQLALAPSISSNTFIPIAFHVSTVALPKCGGSTTFSSPSSPASTCVPTVNIQARHQRRVVRRPPACLVR